MSAKDPYLDPDFGPPWREIVEVLLGGSGPRFDVDSLGLMRSLDFPTPEAHLSRDAFATRRRWRRRLLDRLA